MCMTCASIALNIILRDESVVHSAQATVTILFEYLTPKAGWPLSKGWRALLNL